MPTRLVEGSIGKNGRALLFLNLLFRVGLRVCALADRRRPLFARIGSSARSKWGQPWVWPSKALPPSTARSLTTSAGLLCSSEPSARLMLHPWIRLQSHRESFHFWLSRTYSPRGYHGDIYARPIFCCRPSRWRFRRAPNDRTLSPPADIPMAAYTNFSCEQLEQEMIKEQTALSAISKAQNDVATGDAVGVFLIGVPMSSTFGGDKEGQVSVAKGKVQAIQSAMMSKGCNTAPTPLGPAPTKPAPRPVAPAAAAALPPGAVITA
jgi:hypothetical protein